MPDKDFEQMLKDLRTQYLDKPEMTTGIKKSRNFKTSSSEEKEIRLLKPFNFSKRGGFSCLINLKIYINKMQVMNKFPS